MQHITAFHAAQHDVDEMRALPLLDERSSRISGNLAQHVRTHGRRSIRR